MSRDVDAALSRVTTALAAARNTDGGWPYHAGRKSRLEATCWAALGLDVPVTDTPVARWQTSAGLVIEPSTGQANYAFNGLAALALAAAGPAGGALAGRVADALLVTRGVTIPPSPAIRQDTSLQGWPWMEGTFSWVEPTAWCLLAVKRLSHDRPEGRARIDVAERLLQDRACTGGGWNYGNSVVYGADLPAHVPPTAVGVLALQDKASLVLVRDAVRLLLQQAPREASLTSLALAALALAALGDGAGPLVGSLATRCLQSLGLENAAVLGMAAYALRTVGRGRSPGALMTERMA